MIYDLIQFGGVVFWTLVAAFLIFVVFLLKGERDEGKLGGTLIVTLIFGSALFFFSDFPRVNPTVALLSVGAYLAVGLFYASTRWYLFLRQMRQFIAKHSQLSRSEMVSKLAYSFNTHRFPPTPGEHSEKLWFWSLFWPLDIASKVLTVIYDRFVLIFSSISRSMFKDVSLPDEKNTRL